MGTDIACGWNYLFTTILFNTWYLWINLDPEHRIKESFNDFCQALATSLITSRAAHDYMHPELHDDGVGIENQDLNIGSPTVDEV